MQAGASATGSLTVVASGGSSVGDGWSYSSGVLTLTSNSSIDASVIAGYLSSNLVIEATSILISSSITSSTSSDLTLRSNGNIRVAGGVEITTQGGDITFQSNFDDSGTGSIRL